MEIKEKVDSASIKNEISEVLKSQISACEASKACLFNLILYTQEKNQTNYFKNVVNMIKSQFPCRIIFILGEPNAKENLLKIKIDCK